MILQIIGIRKWHLKAVLQKTLSVLPFKYQLNHYFQKYITKGVQLTEFYFQDRLQHAKAHLNAYTNKYNTSPASALEIGTGWYPVVPLYYFLNGVKRIYLNDVVQLSNKQNLLTTIEKYIQLTDSENVNSEAWNQLQSIYNQSEDLSFEDILEQLGMHYEIGEISQLEFSQSEYHLISSNNTFEHIYRESFPKILQKLHALVSKENGLMSHYIDMSDHFSHTDNSITNFNFLKFSESQWKWIDNSIQPMNRMRLCEFEQVYKELNIPIQQIEIDISQEEVLSTVKLDPYFNKMDKEQLAVTHCYVVS